MKQAIRGNLAYHRLELKRRGAAVNKSFGPLLKSGEVIGRFCREAENYTTILGKWGLLLSGGPIIEIETFRNIGMKSCSKLEPRIPPSLR
jgi:hypothetical protein